MHFVVRPLGAVAIVGIVATATFMVARRNATPPAFARGASGGAGAPSAGAPHLTRPERGLALGGLTAPGWTVSPDRQFIEKKLLGVENEAFSLGKASLQPDQGSFSVRVRGLESGKTSPYPKYGIRITGANNQDNFSVWIDAKSAVLTTFGKIGDTTYDWHTSPLPAGFDMTKEHLLKIEWYGDGREWRFSLDDDEQNAQRKHIAGRLTPATVSLLTHDTRASFTACKVR